jgi:phosphoesterase RecJ-like protein
MQYLKPIDLGFIQAVKECLSHEANIAIIIHYNPDGDAVGAAMGLFNYLKRKFHVKVIIPNNFPDFLGWIEGASQALIFSRNREEVISWLEKTDVLFFLDFNSIKRIEGVGEFVEKSKAKKFLIDHHPNPEPFADYTFSDVSASSASEMVFRFLLSLDPENMNNMIANCLFTGLMTDTNCFTTNSSNAQTFQIAGLLLDYGINREKIYSNTYESYSESRMRLMGYCLSEKMKVFPQFKVAYISLNKEELKRYHYSQGDSEGFVNLPFSIKGVNFSVFFTENKEFIRVSFRSKGRFDTNAFARAHFNGGGHVNASGGRYYGPIDEAVRFLEQLMPEYSKQLDYEV